MSCMIKLRPSGSQPPRICGLTRHLPACQIHLPALWLIHRLFFKRILSTLSRSWLVRDWAHGSNWWALMYRLFLPMSPFVKQWTDLLPGSIAEVLEFCLKSTYFCFNSKFYEQQEGGTMGSPVLAVVANLYTEYFEAKVCSEMSDYGKNLSMTQVQSGEAQELLSHLNSVRPSIQFTVEEEQDGVLHFLDVYMKWREEGTLDIYI